MNNIKLFVLISLCVFVSLFVCIRGKLITEKFSFSALNFYDHASTFYSENTKPFLDSRQFYVNQRKKVLCERNLYFQIEEEKYMTENGNIYRNIIPHSRVYDNGVCTSNFDNLDFTECKNTTLSNCVDEFNNIKNIK